MKERTLKFHINVSFIPIKVSVIIRQPSVIDNPWRLTKRRTGHKDKNNK